MSTEKTLLDELLENVTYYKEGLPSWLYEHFKDTLLSIFMAWLRGDMEEKEARVRMDTLISYHRALVAKLSLGEV
ncbi:MAG: hypothetical protein QXI60_09910 [Thermofilaceae archaeon]